MKYWILDPILHQLSLVQSFIHPMWCRISTINGINWRIPKYQLAFPSSSELWHQSLPRRGSPVAMEPCATLGPLGVVGRIGVPDSWKVIRPPVKPCETLPPYRINLKCEWLNMIEHSMYDFSTWCGGMFDRRKNKHVWYTSETIPIVIDKHEGLASKPRPNSNSNTSVNNRKGNWFA